MTSYQYRKSHCGDKTVLWPSYLHNRISYTGKMSSLYWIRAQVNNSIECYQWSISIGLDNGLAPNQCWSSSLIHRYTEMQMLSFWWNYHHWLHWKLSNDNFQYSQWWKFRQNDNISVSVIYITMPIEGNVMRYHGIRQHSIAQWSWHGLVLRTWDDGQYVIQIT